MSADGQEELAQLFADIAQELAAAETLDETLQVAVERAAETVTGCDAAAVALVLRGGRIATPAYTDRRVVEFDRAQYELGEGPCLDAIREQEIHVTNDLDAQDRWPRLRERTADLSIDGVLAFRLFLDEDTLGALNLYASEAGAFNEDSIFVGRLFASHCAVALKAAITDAGRQEAIRSRDLIGQAKGIIMERRRLSAQEAFALLRRISQRQNRRVRDVAEQIAETGEVPEDGG